MTNPKKKLRPEDRIITSLEILKMRFTDVIDKFYDIEDKIISAAGQINTEIKHIERCKEIRYRKKASR